MPSHEAVALLVSPKSQIAQLFRAGHRKVHFYEKKNVLDKHTFPSSTTSKELHFTVTLQRKKSIHTSKGGTRPEKIISTNHPNLSNVSALIRSVSSVPNTFRVNINKTHRIWKKRKMVSRQKWCGPANNITVKYLKVEGQQTRPFTYAWFWFIKSFKS